MLLVLSYDANGNPTFIRTPKGQALEPYVGKKLTSKSENGYDPL